MQPVHIRRHAVRRAAILAIPRVLVLLLLLPLGACAPAASRSAATPAPTPTPDPLDRLSVYVPTLWNLCVLRASDGKQRACYNQQNGAVPFGSVFGVVDGIVYGAFGDVVYALRGSTGAYLWRQTFPDGEGAVGAVLAGTTWYVATGAPNHQAGPSTLPGSLYAMRLSDGALLWRDRLDGYVGAPVLSADILYEEEDTDLGWGNDTFTVTARRATDGTLLWRYPLGLNKGALFAVGDGALYLCGSDGVVKALRLSDRTPLWHHGVPGCATLQAIGDALYVGSSINQGHTNAFVALRPSDGSPLWQVQGALPTVPVTLDQGVVYLATYGQSTGHGEVIWISALSAADGHPVWQTSIVSSANGSATVGVQPLSVVADRVFVGAMSAPMMHHPHLTDVYALDAQYGRVLWNTPITRGIETMLAGPVLVGT
jgi:outer membrane protein assembly factor BamB